MAQAVEIGQAQLALTLGHYLDVPIRDVPDAGLAAIESAHLAAGEDFARETGRQPNLAAGDDLRLLWDLFCGELGDGGGTAGFAAACTARLRSAERGELPAADGAMAFGRSVQRHLADLVQFCHSYIAASPERLATWTDRPRRQPFQSTALMQIRALRLADTFPLARYGVTRGGLLRQAAARFTASIGLLHDRHKRLVVAAARTLGAGPVPNRLESYTWSARAFVGEIVLDQPAAA
jgi:hypothetical protein